jgi:hypothetical protein
MFAAGNFAWGTAFRTVGTADAEAATPPATDMIKVRAVTASPGASRACGGCAVDRPKFNSDDAHSTIALASQPKTLVCGIRN